MQRLLRELDGSPLRKFYSLESNLKRERRVFSIVIVLLVSAALSVAAMTVTGLFQTAFRQEEQSARIHEKEVVDVFLQRRMMLTTASLVLQLRMNGAPSALNVLAPNTCTPMTHNARDDAILRESCDYTVQLLTNSGQTPSVEMITADGSVGYGYLFPTGDLGALRSGTPSEIVSAVLERYRKRGVDPLDAARKKPILWFAVGSGGRGEELHMIGASVVFKNDKLYALVLTSVDLYSLVSPIERAGRVQQPVVVDSDGVPLVEADDAEMVRKVDERLVGKQDGLYHWIPGFGWALRRPALFAGFGHMMYLLPLGLQLRSMRYELWLVGGATLVLIVLLFVAFRYWNYRFLTRIYAEASRALESEMLNHLLVHATPVGLCIVRRATLEIVVANPIARTMLGLRISDRHLPQELQSAFESSLAEQEAQSDDARIFQFPFSLSRTGHSAVHIEITYAPATLNAQGVFFCAITDMTAHHQAEILLREAKLTSDAAAKAKVAFFASMSHEIRTPLSSLVGNIELIARGPLAPEQQARVKAMETSARGLMQVVNDVLDFSKIDVGELSLMEEWSNISDLLDRLALSHAPLATQQGLKFYMVFERNLPARLYFDPVRVSQIVNNLLSNALKFTPSGKIVLRAGWHAGELEISVTDSGIGIPDDLKHRLFLPFTQGDSNRLRQARGTGLGLSICARLCELMKGRIDLESTVGVGTRIAVVLPLNASEADSSSACWTLPHRRVAVLGRAQENLEWLGNLFDPGVTAVTALANPVDPIDEHTHDFLMVTDEFAPAEVLSWWKRPDSIVWVGQAGPLVPRRRGDGGVEVSIYSLAGLKSATQMLAAGRTARVDTGHEPQGSAAGVTVLIVEDNLLNRSLLFDQLTTLGVRVIEAKNGEEALALLSKEPVDVVMTDIDMPVMDGFQLLAEMRKLGMTIPAYAVSASARPEDVADGRARGFTDYLAKPVPLERLETVIRACCSVYERELAEDDAHDVLPDVPEVPAAYAQVFVAQAGREIAEFDAILVERALSKLRRWLHGVSGGIAVLGASALHEQCQELRTYVRESTEWNHEIELQASAIRDALQRMVATLKGE
ncbi:hybrid sensor histidine kinase/response regulator [Burkholderia mayonis]|uniref:Virulence sensor protein BvgS n=1 Tax=Burkholderia mayonis TaxID=1385591 RepID=A0A1B4FJ94_9BURK|nr:hybrid sensor histidine kinase/response regulator [Burkholderia mayonis]AOJ03765.1 hybrid sensor histidine kinase/response regulator [Burkholderia mayonis]KVE42491.1 hybrid sensor histidine kinase/response regulator [Burkholderia mayonis]